MRFLGNVGVIFTSVAVLCLAPKCAAFAEIKYGYGDTK